MFNRLVRQILLKILGDEKYLSLVSNIFLKMYHSGRARKRYPEMYFLKNLVSEGNTCIDVGANLGYYTIPLAEIVGDSGKIYAVEPVELFRSILEKNLIRYKIENRVKITPYALGDTDNMEVEMGTPSVNGLVHFGYTKILSSDKEKLRNTYKVKIRKPQTLFSELAELHFIKCDIEGYENVVIPEFAEIIKKFKPSLQIEICPERNREMLINMLRNFGYQVFYLTDGNLYPLKAYNDNLNRSCDLYFLQPNTIASL